MQSAQSVIRRADDYIFVSYRSLDVLLVRPCVELLAAANVDLWFAEYEILLANRSTFRENFVAGAATCDRAIAFTSTEYWNSNHTCEELRTLLDHNKQILDIQLRESTYDAIETQEAKELHRRFYARSPRRRAYHTRADDGSLASWIVDCFELNVGRLIQQQSHYSCRREFYLGGRDSFLLDIGEWAIADDRHRADLDIRPSQSSALRHYRWRMADRPPDLTFGIPESAGVHGVVKLRQTRSATPLGLNIYGGPWESEESFENIPTNDDRLTFDALARIASEYLSHDLSGQFRCHGAHLFVHNKHGHLAFTYSGVSETHWARKYIVRANPSGEEIELTFTLSVRGDFKDFLQAVPFADEVVASLVWNPTRRDLYGDRLTMVRFLYVAPFLVCGSLFSVLVELFIKLPFFVTFVLSILFALGAGCAALPVVGKYVANRLQQRDKGMIVDG